MMPELAEIEERRQALGIAKAALARAAGIAASYYSYFLLGNRVQPRPDMIARLRMALERLRRGQVSNSNRDYAVAVSYRLAVALAADALQVDAGLVHRSDPGRRATHSASWMSAAEVRRLACYLLNVGIGFTQADTARAAGLTKQGVCEAVRAIEDRREDPAFEALVEKLTTAIMGDW
jgi:transcriptional regulator with XRE-family HTH domain/DNA-binding XRE family transcriptional regulator